MASPKNPFFLFPWNRDFIEPFMTKLRETEDGIPLGIPLVISPTSRPWLYLQERYKQKRNEQESNKQELKKQEGNEQESKKQESNKQDDWSGPMPQCRTFETIATLWYEFLEGRPAVKAGVLDRIMLLFDAVKTTGSDKLAGLELAGRELADFLPWGHRLSVLLDEMWSNGIEPTNLGDQSANVPPYAAKLLARLGAIAKAYAADLDRRGLTTEGLMLDAVGRRIKEKEEEKKKEEEEKKKEEEEKEKDRAGGSRPKEEEKRDGGPVTDLIPPMLRTKKGRQVFIAGFHVLRGMQEKLLKVLWEQGAIVTMHTDPRMVQDPENASCRGHREWIKNWKAATEPVNDSAESKEADGGSGTLSDGPTETTHTEPHTAQAPKDTSCSGHSKRKDSGGADTETVDVPAESKEADGGGTLGDGPRVSFLSGYDLHSQLACLTADLAKQSREEGAACGTRAVVLPTPSLMLPVLHHLPPEERSKATVTMGFPLTELGITQLIRDILAVQATRRVLAKDGDEGAETKTVYYWKDMLALFENTLLGSLPADALLGVLPQNSKPGDGMSGSPVPSEASAPSALGGLTIRELAAPFCATVRRGGVRFVNPAELLVSGTWFADMSEDEKKALRALLAIFAKGFDDAGTPAKLASALRRACKVLQEGLNRAGKAGTGQGGHAAQLEREGLNRLEGNVLPELEGELMGEENLSVRALGRVLDLLLSRERIFFDSSHIGPDRIQVMGVLDTTLLSFEHIYIVDATDVSLPGPFRHDPLLPDTLRQLVNLPPLNSQDEEVGYAMHRLCASSPDIHFYWQEGAVKTFLFDGNKARSRFVEEYIWCEEQRRNNAEKEKAKKEEEAEKEKAKKEQLEKEEVEKGQAEEEETKKEEAEDKTDRILLKPGKEPLLVASTRLKPQLPAPRALSLAEGTELRARMDRFLDSPISPTAMDSYMKCPLRFGYQYLAGLAPMDIVNEGDDPAGVGTLVHEVLQLYHGGHMGTAIGSSPEARKAAKKELRELFDRHLLTSRLRETLPPMSLSMLEAAAHLRLALYVDGQPDDGVPICLEGRVETKLSVPVIKREFRIQGRFDRLDRRGSGLVILDYKTGHVPEIRDALWKDKDFFTQAKAILEGSPESQDRASLNRSLGMCMDLLTACAESVQLPCYIAIGAKKPEITVDRETHRDWPEGEIANAAFVELRESGAEKPVFRPGKDGKLLPVPVDDCRISVSIVLAHMATADELPQKKDTKNCTYCPYAELCAE